jgi:hypothetical protein
MRKFIASSGACVSNYANWRLHPGFHVSAISVHDIKPGT